MQQGHNSIMPYTCEKAVGSKKVRVMRDTILASA
jgi:hypothetical protein